MPQQTVLAVYRVRRDAEDRFLDLLRGHLPTLREHGLVSDGEATVLRGRDEQDRAYVVEIFDWASPEAAAQAHDNAAVGQIWGELEGLCEPRDGRPAAEFPHVERLRL